MKLNEEAYRELINDDVKWLDENTEDTLEHDHIVQVLWDSISCYYPKKEN